MGIDGSVIRFSDQYSPELLFLFLHVSPRRLGFFHDLVLKHPGHGVVVMHFHIEAAAALGTSAFTTVFPPLLSMPWMRPRRLLRSPMMLPAKSSGTVISTAMTGSRSDGPATSMAFLNAMRHAIWNDMSFESTS